MYQLCIYNLILIDRERETNREGKEAGRQRKGERKGDRGQG